MTDVAAAGVRGRRSTRDPFASALGALVAATFVLRVAIGASTSWAFDDFAYRELLADSLSIQTLTASHGGHVSPIGLTAQWLVQHAFPGSYVPLMIFSALCVALAQVGISRWVAVTYRRASTGLAAAAFLGLTTLILELSTWWSVALYAAPMLASSSWLLYATAQYLHRGHGLRLVVALLIVSLLASVKAVLLPLLLLTLAATTPVPGPSSAGYRRALTQWRRMWVALSVIVATYLAFYVLSTQANPTSIKSPLLYARWIADLWTNALFPALWGGPWAWAGRFGVLEVPQPLIILALAATVLASFGVFRLGGDGRRALAGWAVYALCSAMLVAYARAGFSLAGPSLRYVFDIALPTVFLLVVVFHALPDNRVGRPRRRWPVVLAAAWLASTAVTYVYAWPHELPITPWSAAVRAQYPAVRDGLLEQPMPAKFVLAPERLATYLTGDKGAPPERAYVIDELLGFDEDGRLITSTVAGTPVVPPTSHCQYTATLEQDLAIPLTAPVPFGRHTMSIDYSSTSPTTVAVGLDRGGTEAKIPAGEHRLYAVVEGGGPYVNVAVSNPIATLCVDAITVGWITPDARVRR